MNFEEERAYTEEDLNLPYQIKLDLWETAFGLQKTDGLVPSNYMISLAKEHIKDSLTYTEIYEKISAYYKEKVSKKIARESRTEEADISSLRIVELLSSSAFSLSPTTLSFYHQRLFEGIENFRYPVGKFRNTNIEKAEPVLGGRSVQYEQHELLSRTLNWEFEQEKNFSYKGLSLEEIAEHAMKFIANIWQIHPFREGNTRTIAVFTIQYLRSFGFEINKEPFKNHAQYFRDALVLANDLVIYRKDDYLKYFTENILFGQEHELTRKNIFIHQLLANQTEEKAVWVSRLKTVSTLLLEEALTFSDYDKMLFLKKFKRNSGPKPNLKNELKRSDNKRIK